MDKTPKICEPDYTDNECGIVILHYADARVENLRKGANSFLA